MDYLKELNIKIGQYVKLKDGTITQIIESNTGNNFAFDKEIDIELNQNILMFLGEEKALLQALKDNIVKVADSIKELENNYMIDINKIIDILSRPAVRYQSKIANIGKISFEESFKKDKMIVEIDEKLDFDYNNYNDPEKMTIKEKEHMKLDYDNARRKQKHERIMITVN